MKHFFRLPVIIGSLPVTLTNGTTADATQVMSDLNWVVNQTNANAADKTLVALIAANNNFTVVQSGQAATQAANFPIASQVQNNVFNTLSSNLGTNTITARIAALSLSAYAVGQIFTFLPTQPNTASVTLNIDGLGSAVIKSGGQQLMGGELGSNAVIVRMSTIVGQPVLDLINSQRTEPPGMTKDFAGLNAPPGYLLCDGASYSTTTFAALFAAIGYLWGGAGASFNVPDSRRRVSAGSGGSATATLGSGVGSTGGAETVTLISSQVPATGVTGGAGGTGVYGSAGGSATGFAVGDTAGGLVTNAAVAGGGGSHSNVQPTYIVTKIIKT